MRRVPDNDLGTDVSAGFHHGMITFDTTSRASAGLAASSRASMMTLNRGGCSFGQEHLGAQGEVIDEFGRGADAAVAIFVGPPGPFSPSRGRRGH